MLKNWSVIIGLIVKISIVCNLHTVSENRVYSTLYTSQSKLPLSFSLQQPYQLLGTDLKGMESCSHDSLCKAHTLLSIMLMRRHGNRLASFFALKRKQVSWAAYSQLPSCGAAWNVLSTVLRNREANETRSAKVKDHWFS